MKNPSAIIDALGGTTKVASICEVKPPSVSEWRKNGIPKSRVQYLRLLYPSVFESGCGELSPKHPESEQTNGINQSHDQEEGMCQ